MADLSQHDLVADEGPAQNQFRMFGHGRVPPVPSTTESKQPFSVEERLDSGMGNSIESQDLSGLEGVREFLSSDARKSFHKQGDSFTSGLHNQLRNLSISEHEHSKDSLKSNRCDSGVCDSGHFSVEEPLVQLQAGFPECHLSSTVSYDSVFSLQELEELSSQDEDGDTPLHMSIILMLPDVALKIVSLAHSQACISLPNALHQTPLHLAVLTRQFCVARSLIVAGATLEAPDFCGNSPLHLACREGLWEVALCLLTPVQCPEQFASSYPVPLQKVPQDLSLKNYDGYTCAHLALMAGHVEILALLLQKGAEVNEADGKSGHTLLHMAVDLGNTRALHLLLAHRGLNLNALTYSGLTAVALARGRGFGAFEELLCRHGADCSQLLQQPEDPHHAHGESTDEEMNEGVYDDICINGKPVQFT